MPSEPVLYADPHLPGSSSVGFVTRTWTSPVTESAFPATELVVSWNARTAAGTWIAVEARVTGDGPGAHEEWTPWLVLARWCEDDPDAGGAITRTTVPEQRTAAAEVLVDSVVAAPGRPFLRWQVRVVLARQPGEQRWPVLSLVGAMVATAGANERQPVSAPVVRAIELAVPPLSQRLHVGSHPDWNDGGRSWCSPTATTMLLAYWGLAPTRAEVQWVPDGPDRQVVHAVRQVFDRDYGGAGNWAFNTAYAATRGLRAYVTRLRDLAEAERFVAGGVPLVVGVSFTANELDGAGYDTNGHLLTIVGFTSDGDVICNDPNSHRIASNEQVRAVFRRDQFERVWLRGGAGLTYVMHPPSHRLPEPPAQANWA